MDGDESAYPLQIINDDFDPGMTKRELLAAMAMQGLLTNAGLVDCYEKIANLAVNHADALIAELSKAVQDE
jgi:hypothetical protein